MDEIVVDDREVVAVDDGVEELLAHAHQRDGAAGREIEAAQQLQPARLGGAVNLGRGIVGRGRAPVVDGGFELLVVGPVAARQRLEEGDAGAGLELAVAGQDFARERDAGGLAAAGQQFVAELDQGRGPLLVGLAPVAGPVDQRTAAFRDGLQHIAEEGCAHSSPNLSPCRPIR